MQEKKIQIVKQNVRTNVIFNLAIVIISEIEIQCIFKNINECILLPKIRSRMLHARARTRGGRFHVPRRIRMYYRHRLGLEENLGKLLKERENHLLKREV